MPRLPKGTPEAEKAAAIARAAWEIPDGQEAIRKTARVPANLADLYRSLSIADRGQAFADGIRIRNSLPALVELVNRHFGLEPPSWIVDKDSVTVIWGQHSATASSQVEAVLNLIEEIGRSLEDK